jgi:hypothetical protein
MSDTRPPVPPVALRTYTAIRMGVVVVIVALGFAVWREIAHSPDHCVQRSLSAYFYTPVRPVFVGALLVLGFAMIVMWGMTMVEDNAFNLAGLLLMVVAFVPTLDANYCSLPASVRGQVPRTETREIADDALIQANAATVARSFSSLLFVLWLLLVFIAITGAVVYVRAPADRRPTRPALIAYVVTWGLALAAVIVYTLLYQDADNPDSAFNHHVHGWSANIAVALIVVAVVSAAVQKARSDVPGATKWAWFYGGVAAAMVVAAVVLKGGDHFGLFHGWVDEHATFLVEAILIGLLGLFWSLQTIDRRHEGAPTY